ncbi:probable E3 ubiquitin-protein ligase ZFP1 [Vigna unguiculata]|uniref:probable E3 ubiquitin-protein ligase ZFP1 n=1 Tax=Vigna unguiculata TaxID=3917 RepID=UPI0010170081|nr:probable E3 ubiquitin-protein ligase ZFP1 [Vigna unguiculata]
MNTPVVRRGSRRSMMEFPPLCGPHSDMIVDTEDMSYETFSSPELLELGEWIGNDNLERGLPKESIARQLQTKTYLLPNDLEGSTSEERQIDICIICQDEYKNKEEIGILQCGHEYHTDCIRRWLDEKNVCPICKSKALSIT